MVTTRKLFVFLTAACFCLVAHSLILLEDIKALQLTTYQSLIKTKQTLRETRKTLEDFGKGDFAGVAGESPAPTGDAFMAVLTAITDINEDLRAKLDVAIVADDLGTGHFENCDYRREVHTSLMVTTYQFLESVFLIHMMELFSGSEHTERISERLQAMQSLWASRSANKQHLSFIEQKRIFFAATLCFNLDKELRRDVELVELLNEMIDNFRQLSVSIEMPNFFQLGSYKHGGVDAAFKEVESSDQWKAIQRCFYILRIREMELPRLVAQVRNESPSDLTTQTFLKAYDSAQEVFSPAGNPGLSSLTIANLLDLQFLLEPLPKNGAISNKDSLIALASSVEEEL